ncbi:type 1 fimbrial protein [Chryseobacterium vrystaatense]|uniref:Uncharacterized protein n=1 Tax=Chryseobacterium vrystaatense TaxID=307480 RepID=A0A1M5I9E2_9FLAO|nr:type 1 fimbrial protein [Chryseobacterium vrystaatense]SHG24994.1 hypothetical protein SAMN02787073_3792 [Chryseobacterium vrystaatense]
MKTIFLKIVLILSLLSVFNCKAQVTNDYINFYNEVVPKLNSIVPNKTQFYGQNFSNFYNELQNKNINIILLNCDTKTDPGTKYYILRLFFTNTQMWSTAIDHSFQFPSIAITFENEIPPQIVNMLEQSGSKWTSDYIQFFSNMKIEKIKFIGVNGYDNSDKSLK